MLATIMFIDMGNWKKDEKTWPTSSG